MADHMPLPSLYINVQINKEVERERGKDMNRDIDVIYRCNRYNINMYTHPQSRCA